MGRCGKCACRVLAGGEHLPAPNWKELKVPGGRVPDAKAMRERGAAR